VKPTAYKANEINWSAQNGDSGGNLAFVLLSLQITCYLRQQCSGMPGNRSVGRNKPYGDGVYFGADDDQHMSDRLRVVCAGLRKRSISTIYSLNGSMYLAQ
jgi:hypothetical protein